MDTTWLARATELVVDWFVAHGIAVIAILVGAFVVRYFFNLFLDRLIRRLVPPSHFHSPAAERQREDTLIQISRGTVQVLVWIVAILMILSEMCVDIGPLLAAAGVVGLAIGFGGQYLIRDVVAGLFIIVENQYRVGDVVCLDSACGVVESVSIRMVTMRDLDGTVHHVPHGTVSKVSNLSKEYARVNLDVGVSYDSDLEKVIRVVNRVGADMTKDPEWKEKIIKAPEFLRVNEFADSAIVIKILGETKPIEQWAVMGELRKRLKIAFDKEGIEIPFPQRVLHQAKSSTKK